MTFVLTTWGAATHPGLRRKTNEDSALTSAGLVLVADGMGGHRHGDLASAAVVRCFEDLAQRTVLTSDDIRSAIDAAHREVSRLGAEVDGGCGSTVAGVAVIEDDGRSGLLVFNVGDSRVYRFRDRQLEQISTDHVVIEPATEQAAERSSLTRAIGMDTGFGSGPGAEYRFQPSVSGDRWLICSDGLTKELSDFSIGEILLRSGTPQHAADMLLQAALSEGGRDNVTVAVLSIVYGAGEAGFDEITLVNSRTQG